MTLFERLTAVAQSMPQRLVLPESKEPRTLQAADRILADKIAHVIFIGHREKPANSDSPTLPRPK